MDDSQKILDAIAAVGAQVTELDTKVTGLDTKLTGLDARVTGLDTKVAGLDAKLTGLDARVTGLDTKVTGLDTKVAGLDAKLTGLDARVTVLGASQDRTRSEIMARIDRLQDHFTVMETNLDVNLDRTERLRRDVAEVRGIVTRMELEGRELRRRVGRLEEGSS